MSINKLIKGYKDFYNKFKNDETHSLKKLSKSQKPSTVIVSCSDSRVDPSMLMNADHGDVFVIRNVANIVAPKESDTHHNTTSALKFAIDSLNVKNLIIMGHSNCGGIKALIEEDCNDTCDICKWVKNIKDIKNNIPAGIPHHEKIHFCEKEGIKKSIQNALTFDFIKEKHGNGDLNILGWYFDIESGKMHQYDEHVNEFVSI